MNKLILAIMVVSILTWSPAVGIAKAEDAAMVLDLDGGRADYMSGSRSGRPVEIMDFLSAGEQIKIDSKTTLILNYFSSGKREVLTGPGGFVVGEKHSKPESGLKVKSSNAAFTPARAVIDESKAQHAGTVAMRSLKKSDPFRKAPGKSKLEIRREMYWIGITGPAKVAPLNHFRTAVTGKASVFKWKPVEGGQAYVLKVFDANGAGILEWVTNETRYEYDGPPLNPGGRYKWTITALAGRGEIASGGSDFWVLSEERLRHLADMEKKIRQAPGSTPGEISLSLAMLYKKMGLYDAAARELRVLVDNKPKNEKIKRQLILVDPSVMN